MTTTHSQMVKAIFDLLPEAQFVLTDTDYENIQWLDERPKPQWSDIEKAIANPLPDPIDTAKEAAEAKLAALGLTAEDLKALGL
jgi:broad specificity phosphatase PhoE